MTIYHGRNQFLTLGTPTNVNANINVTGDLQETSLPLDQDLADITTAGSVGHRFHSGLEKSARSFKFVANGTTNGSFATLANFAAIQQANPSNYWSANYGPGGSTNAYPKVTFNFLVKSCSLPVKVADVVTMTVTWEADNGFTVATY